MEQIKTIGILTYPSCSEQDTITPLEIFRGAAMVLSQKLKILPTTAAPQSLDVKLVSIDEGNTKMQMGTEVVPDALLDESVTYDLFYVPGGVGAGAVTKNERVLRVIRAHYEKGKVVASNCSGVGVLFRAGILGNTPVTCVAGIARRLRELGANVPQPRRMWQGEPEARLWTSTGSYGVHGGAAALVAHYFGRDVATTVGMMFDTLGGLGDAMYQKIGPEFYYHPELEAQFQSFWEDMLLPK
jgi:putative intracellular protease/amidase